MNELWYTRAETRRHARSNWRHISSCDQPGRLDAGPAYLGPLDGLQAVPAVASVQFFAALWLLTVTGSIHHTLRVAWFLLSLQAWNGSSDEESNCSDDDSASSADSTSSDEAEDLTDGLASPIDFRQKVRLGRG